MRGLVPLAIILSGLFLFSSCSKLDDSTEMNISITPTQVDFTIPITTSLDTGITVISIPATLDLDAMIKLQNKRFSTANIKSIRLTNVVLTLTDTAKAVTIASVQNLKLTIQAGGKTTNLLASVSAPDSPVKSLNVPVTATVNDLQSFVSDGNVTYVFKGNLRKAPVQNLVGKATMTYRVELAL